MSTTPEDQNKNSSNSQPHEDLSKSGAPPRPRSRWRVFLRRLAWLSLIFVCVGAATIGGAEYYTAQPNFCGSCHVMDPYYTSWSHDKHGKKLGVRCVDCHYAPGEKFTFHAKFKGLSQATSYFSGRYGAGRPRAHVSDASCLTSGCHGNGEFMKKIFSIGEERVEKRYYDGQQMEVERRPTVHFNHEKHLKNLDQRLKGTEDEMDQLLKKLQVAMLPDSLAKVKAASMSIRPAAERESSMRGLLVELKAEEHLDDAISLMRLQHSETRLKQLAGMNCAGCHTYDASGTHHLTVERQTCFTCHFINQEFNQETGACLKCHEPPVRRIAIHAVSTKSDDQAGMMDHRDIVERGIDCASCHRDVVQGSSEVMARDCSHCHDRSSYLKDFDHRTTETVTEYHRIHVAEQRARCADCHRSIQHRLIEPTQVGSSASLLEPVLNDCQHCHPGHHREQVELLMGVGGKGLPRPMPNAMFGSRINCQACHTKSAVDQKGDALLKATEAACVACHSNDYKRLLKQWQDEIQTTLTETQKSLERVEKRAAEVLQRDGKLPPHVQEAIDEAKRNTHFIEIGNGIHNKGYSLLLLENSMRNLDDAMISLTK